MSSLFKQTAQEQEVEKEVVKAVDLNLGKMPKRGF